MILLYNLFIYIYQIAVRIAAIRNSKAAEWINGRKNLFNELDKISQKNNIVWVHSASAGEFEQAKPVIEALKNNFPHYQIAISFFSPSGYKVGKKYALADHVFYLPLDTSSNAQRLLKKLNPQLVIFIKYDFWYHHLKAINNSGIPLILVSSIFRQQQPFFKWYGSFFKKLLHYFTWIFVQDEASFNLLQTKGFKKVSVGGDTRFDRVLKIANQFTEVPYLKEFTQDASVVVAGSTWPDDEERLLALTTKGFEKLKLVIAPHEIEENKINNISNRFPNAIKYSQITDATALQHYSVLIIDNIGMLSKLYKYATLTYIGGGYNKSGIHNTLEAAVYGKPVLFGPNYQKFKEARELIKAGGAYSINTANDLLQITNDLLNNQDLYAQSCNASQQYITENTGATQKVIELIQAKRLLTK